MKQNQSRIICYFDGSCEPRNPGGAMGLGVVIYKDQEQVFTFGGYFPPAPQNSNNVAEYRAFEVMLDYLITHKPITIYGDSMMVIQQMSQNWKIKNGLYTEHAFRCLGKFKTHFANVALRWVPREQNAVADRLSKGQMIANKIEFKLQKQDHENSNIESKTHLERHE